MGLSNPVTAQSIGAVPNTRQLIAGANVTIDGAGSGALDEDLTIAAAGGGGGGIVESIVAGANVTVDDTDPANPIVAASGGGSGIVESIVAGANVTVDDTDPANPIVAASGGGGGGGNFALIDAWDFAVDGAAVGGLAITGITADDLIIVMQNVIITLAGVAQNVALAARASVNNGVSYLTNTGDYIGMNTNGIQTNFNCYRLSAAQTTPAGMIVRMSGLQLNGVPKFMLGSRDQPIGIFGSLSPVNALLLSHHGSATNFDLGAGKVWVFGR
jgi:hypothetical protein